MLEARYLHVADDMSVPLCVDLDGTLVKTDLLWESLLATARVRPWAFLLLPLWILRGRAAMKRALAETAVIDFARLPFRVEVIEFVRARRASGQRTFLATASTHLLASRVADTVGVFDGVFASDAERNLKGPKKAKVLVEEFGLGGFDYVGDSRADRPVWRAARNVFVVGNVNPWSGSDRQRVFERIDDKAKSWEGVRAVFRALRIHQWAKNLLVFVPLFAAHRLSDVPAIIDSFLAFVTFCLAASSAYVFNDLLDLDADRAHPRKRRRPFASGDLSIPSGLAMGPLLLVTAAAMALMLPPLFQWAMGAYFVSTIAYSTTLKRRIMIDVITLAGLYTLRILGGGFAIGAPVSFWMLGFAMFMFLSLALVKRFTEFIVQEQNDNRQVAGRGYRVEDKPVVMGLGMASGMTGVLVLALYINSDAVSALYRSPNLLWLVCPPLLYWVGRIWIIAGRGKMHDDPIVFAARDRMSYIVAALIAVAVWLAT